MIALAHDTVADPPEACAPPVCAIVSVIIPPEPADEPFDVRFVEQLSLVTAAASGGNNDVVGTANGVQAPQRVNAVGHVANP